LNVVLMLFQNAYSQLPETLIADMVACLRII
jgi:hypothetical protein